MVEKDYYTKMPVENYADFRDAAEVVQRIFAAIDDTDGIEEADIEGEVRVDLDIDLD